MSFTLSIALYFHEHVKTSHENHYIIFNLQLYSSCYDKLLVLSINGEGEMLVDTNRHHLKIP